MTVIAVPLSPGWRLGPGRSIPRRACPAGPTSGPQTPVNGWSVCGRMRPWRSS